jgi:hypothetical protein
MKIQRIILENVKGRLKNSLEDEHQILFTARKLGSGRRCGRSGRSGRSGGGGRSTSGFRLPQNGLGRFGRSFSVPKMGFFLIYIFHFIFIIYEKFFLFISK